MAARTFRVPQPKEKPPDPVLMFSDLPQFNWQHLSSLECIGRGNFGTVDSAIYSPPNKPSLKVVLKQPYDITGNEKEFLKEARLLHSFEEHPNIVKFEAICTTPTYAMMTEYVVFSFKPFGDNTVVSSLADFLQHIDTRYDCEGFEHVSATVMKNLAEGLSYLHGRDVIHRDLKPANILVSNTHYAGQSGDEFLETWSSVSPVVCKLADFGESRSRLIQTQTLLASKVGKIDRGSPVYMSPQIILPELRPVQATIEDLKASDVWALGMVFFVVANPSFKYPYMEEIEQESISFPVKKSKNILEDLIRQQRRPHFSPKYEILQATSWKHTIELHEMCTDFNKEKRITTIDTVCSFIRDTEVAVPCDQYNFQVSQGSALEQHHQGMAQKIAIGVDIRSTEASRSVVNDGTNACIFLALKICDAILSRTEKNDNLGEEISGLTNEIIQNYPSILNPLRDMSSIYTLMNAYVMMRENRHLCNNFEFTEELPYFEGVFANVSRKRLQNKLVLLTEKNHDFVTIYTSEPYSFVIGCLEKRLFILDTHSVPASSGGNGNGLLKLYESDSPEYCRALCYWLWDRLAGAGVKVETGQSLAIVSVVNRSKSKDHNDASMCNEPGDQCNLQSAADEANTESTAFTEVKHPYNDLTITGVDTGPADNGNSQSEDYIDLTDMEMDIEPADPGNLQNDDNASSEGNTALKKLEHPYIDLTNMGVDIEPTNQRKRNAEREMDSKCAKKKVDDETLDSEITTDLDADLPPSCIATPLTYNGDPCLPVYRWGQTKGTTTHEIVNILLKRVEENKHRVATVAPNAIEKNTAFIVDTANLHHRDDVKCDDMGVWIGTGVKTLIFGESSDGMMTKLDEKGCEDEQITMYEVQRYHFRNSSLPSLKKTMVTTRHRTSKEPDSLVFIQYIFTEGERKVDVKSHGNSKKADQPFYRTMPSTKFMLKDTLKEVAPREAMHNIIDAKGGLCNIRSSGEYPRNREQSYNINRRDKNASSSSAGYRPSDPLLEVIVKAKEDQQANKDPFIREVPVHPEPIVFLASQQQLLDIERFCTNPSKFCVLGVDATFNIADYYFTFGTYRNLMLETKKGNNPVCIGPGILHKRKVDTSYKTLPTLMTKYHTGTRGVLAYGTDGEVNISRALGEAFPHARHLQCDIHLRDNVSRKLTQLGITGYPASQIMYDIFGKTVGEEREGGLIDCMSAVEYDLALKTSSEKWMALHQQGKKFLQYFMKEKADIIRNSCRADIRTMCGLGFPPEVYTQNANESMNRLIKSVECKKMHTQKEKRLLPYIEQISKVVRQQMDEQFLAVIGKGDLSLTPDFAHLSVREHDFYRMSTAQQDALKKKFFTYTMSQSCQRKNERPTAETRLSVTAEQSHIIDVPFTILKGMFNKAGDLISQESSLWKTPPVGQSQDVQLASVYMVASTSSPLNPHRVKINVRNGKTECDKQCVHWSTYSLCSHSLAVAETEKMLSNFLELFKKKHREPSITGLSNVNMPTDAGEKKQKATQRRKGASNKMKQAPVPVSVSRVIPPNPQRPDPSFGNFAFAKLEFLHKNVSKCHGCGDPLKPEGVIPRPPEDVVVVTKHFRKYYKDGQLHTSPLSLVYYHLNPNCVQVNHVACTPGLCKVPQDLVPFLTGDHKEAIEDRFKITI